MSTPFPVSGSIGDTRAATRARPLTRGRVLQWLRVTHLWLGLWGAVFGFVFGFTGLFLNHRAVMKIPVERAIVTRAQVAIPQPFANVDELASWVKHRAVLPEVRPTVKTEPTATVLWRGQSVQQLERWSVSLNTTKVSVSAKHIPGSNVVDVETQDATAMGVLTRLHMSNGASAFWVLVSDTIAGALMILALSGVLLWSKLRAPRLLGAAVFIGAPMLAAVYLAMT